MDLEQALLAVGEGEWPDPFEQFAATLDLEWIQQALTATGKATVQRRKLPAEQAVWLMIGMGLFRDRSIQAIAQHLDLVLPPSTAKSPAGSPTSSAVVQARQRLGFEPLSELFRHTAEHWAVSAADTQRWRGRRLPATAARHPDGAAHPSAGRTGPGGIPHRRSDVGRDAAGPGRALPASRVPGPDAATPERSRSR